VRGVAQGEVSRGPAGSSVMGIKGTGSVWIGVAVPISVGVTLTIGTPVKVSVDGGERLSGTIEAWLPQLDAATRTQRARIELDNPEGSLLAGQFVEVELETGSASPQPWVPATAVIADGAQTRVIVQDASGAFRPVLVRTGRSSAGKTEILAGLSGGERVVVSGQLLIDPEANPPYALERLSPPTDKQP